MVRVVFYEDGLAVDARRGDRLLDVCDEAVASIPFSCRDASCATCLIDVLAGQDVLAAPALPERRLLLRIGARPDQRLACQAEIERGEGELRIRAAPTPEAPA